jgi:hypothetical protein
LAAGLIPVNIGEVAAGGGGLLPPPDPPHATMPNKDTKARIPIQNTALTILPPYVDLM